MATINDREAFRARLRKAMDNAGLERPVDLADATGINRITAGSYTRGERMASLEACIAIAAGLGCDPAWLYGGSVESSRALSGLKGAGWSGIGGNAGGRKLSLGASNEKAASLARISAALHVIANEIGCLGE